MGYRLSGLILVIAFCSCSKGKKSSEPLPPKHGPKAETSKAHKKPPSGGRPSGGSNGGSQTGHGPEGAGSHQGPETSQPPTVGSKHSLKIFTPDHLDHQDSIRLTFSEPRNLVAFRDRVTLKQSGKAVAFTFDKIVSDRYLVVRPKRNLIPGVDLKVLVQGEGNSVLLDKSLKVWPTGRWKLSIAGYDPEDGPILIDAKTDPDVSIALSDFPSGVGVSSVVISRLDQKETLEVCSSEACSGQDHFNVSLRELPGGLRYGLNQYQIVSTLSSGRRATQLFEFSYGPIAEGELIDGRLPGSIRAFVDQKSGIQAFSDLLKNFTTQQFKLEYPGGAKNFDEVMNGRKGSSDADRERAQLRASSDSRSSSVARDGTKCLLATRNLSVSYKNIQYLSSMGPFCDIPVNYTYNMTIPGAPKWWGSVDVTISGTANLYITNFERIDDPENIIVNFSARGDNLFDSSLEAKAFAGDYVIIADVNKLTAPFPMSEFFLSPLTGIYVFTGGFDMKEQDYQFSSARQTISFDRDGVLHSVINGFDQFDLKKTYNVLPPLAGKKVPFADYQVTNWANSVKLSMDPKFEKKLTNLNVLDSRFEGILAQVVKGAVLEMIPSATNLMLSDLVSFVSPEAVNRILNEFKKGADLGLPEWSPFPLNKLSLVASAQMGADLKSLHPEGHQDAGLLSSALANVTVGSPLPEPLSPPKLQQGAQSWIRSLGDELPPSPVEYYEESSPGILFSIKKDPLNQAFYQAWKQGFGSIFIDRAFAERHQAATDDDKLIKLIDRILKPKILLSMLDPHRQEYMAEDGSELTIPPDAKVSIRLESLSPPVVDIESGSIKKVPRILLAGSLKMSFVIERPDEPPFTLVSAKLQANAAAQVGFKSYHENHQHPDHGPVSFYLQISEDPEDLVYKLEGIAASNPFSLDMREVERVLDGLVTSLFVPVINQMMVEVPLPPLKGCGMQIDAIELMEVPPFKTGEEPWLLVRVPISTYKFNGVCQL